MKFLREPLVHFLLLGGLLFGVFAVAGQWTVADAGHQIVVAPGRVENLRVSFQRAEGHLPDAQETQGLIDDYVREEVLVREARAAGIDRDDTLVRTILRQQMEYLAAGAAAQAEPSESDLNAYLAAHPAAFRSPDGTVPPLAAILPAVKLAWQTAQRHAVLDAAYRRQLEHYQVSVPAR